MNTMRNLAMAMALGTAWLGNAWAHDGGDRSGPNVVAGSVSSNSAGESAALSCVLEQYLRQSGTTGGGQATLPARSGPREPEARAQASRQGPNIVGEADSGMDRSAPGGSAHRGLGGASSSSARPCRGCVEI